MNRDEGPNRGMGLTDKGDIERHVKKGINRVTLGLHMNVVAILRSDMAGQAMSAAASPRASTS